MQQTIGGNIFDALLESMPVLDTAGNLLCRTAMSDITQRKLAEGELRKHREHLEELVKERTAELEIARDHALESVRLKSIFLNTISHELRTPLNSIIGFTGIMLQGFTGPLNDEQKEQLGMVKTSADHLLSLVTDVLDISKIMSGKLKITNEQFMMHEAYRKRSQDFNTFSRKTGIGAVCGDRAGCK